MERPTLERESVQGEFSLQRLLVMMVQWLSCIAPRTRTGRPTSGKHLRVSTRRLDMARDADITRTLLFSNRGHGCRGCNGGG